MCWFAGMVYVTTRPLYFATMIYTIAKAGYHPHRLCPIVQRDPTLEGKFLCGPNNLISIFVASECRSKRYKLYGLSGGTFFVGHPCTTAWKKEWHHLKYNAGHLAITVLDPHELYILTIVGLSICKPFVVDLRFLWDLNFQFMCAVWVDVH
jgi:hypothetical protein